MRRPWTEVTSFAGVLFLHLPASPYVVLKSYNDKKLLNKNLLMYVHGSVGDDDWNCIRYVMRTSVLRDTFAVHIGKSTEKFDTIYIFFVFCVRP